MKILSNKFRITTIGIVSGHPRFDAETARIIEVLREQSKEPLEFVGVIGDQFADQLNQRFGSTSGLQHQENVIIRNYDEDANESIFNPFRASTHFRNRRLLKSLQANGFFKYLLSNNSPAVIGVGNFSLARRLLDTTAKFYDEERVARPLRLAFDLSITNRLANSEDEVDFIYYNLPKLPVNKAGYTFPSMCIGYESLFRAFRFLQKFRQNKDNNSFLIKEFSTEVNDLVRKARADFRSRNGFTNEQYLTVLAPGETSKQIDFSMKSFSSSLKLFAASENIKSVDKSFFKTLVLLPENKKSADRIRNKASSLSNIYDITFVEPTDRYAALCGSDFAVLHNGEVTVEAAACQLPAIVIDSMPNVNAYVSYLWNGKESPLNVSTGYEGYEELLGSLTAIPEKIKVSMLDHFTRPKLRYHYVKLYRQEIQNMLALNGRNPILSTARTGLELAAEDILRKVGLRNELQTSKPNAGRYDRKEFINLY